MFPCNSHQLYTSWTAEGEKGVIECPMKLANQTHKKERARKGFCRSLTTTTQQVGGTGSAAFHELRKTQQGDLGLHKRTLDQGFQTWKRFNTQIFTARILRKALGTVRLTFHVETFSGMKQSLIFDDVALDPSFFQLPEKSLHRWRQKSAAFTL